MVHFDDVKKLTLDYLKKYADNGSIYFIIRDVFGRISVYIKGDAFCYEIKEELESILGTKWVNTVDSVEESDVIYNEIQRNAVPVYGNMFFTERPLVKKSWNRMEKVPIDITSKIVTFYSYKGGVGRTTALILTALHLARLGYKVAAVDFDLEAPGLSTILKAEDGFCPLYGVIDYLLEYGNTENDLDLNEYIYSVKSSELTGLSGGEVLVMQAGNLNLDNYDQYYNKLSRIDFNMPKYEGNSSPILHLLTGIDASFHPDFIFLDARAGIHDIGGITLMRYSDAVAPVFYGNQQNMLGLQFVLSRLVRASIPFYLIHSPVPLAEEEAAEATGTYAKASLELLSQEGYYSENDIPELFDETSDHCPVNISYDLLATNLNQASKLNSLLNAYGQDNVYLTIAQTLTGLLDSPVSVAPDKEFSKNAVLTMLTDLFDSNTPAGERERNDYEDFKNNFYPLKEYRYIFDNSKFLITGSKGSGKTKLFKVLSCPDYARNLAKYVEYPMDSIISTDWVVGMDSTGDFPIKSNFTALGRQNSPELYTIYWKILAVKKLYPYIKDFITPLPSFAEQINELKYSEIIGSIGTFITIDEQLSDLFWELDRMLVEKNKIVIVTYDALDYVIDSPKRGEIISKLISFWTENQMRMKNLKAKIFLRNDIYNNEILMTDKVKLNNYRVIIDWNYDYLLAMVWKRMVSNSRELCEIFKKALEKHGYSLPESDLVGFVPKPVKEINQICISELIGEKMGKGKKAYTYNWILNRLSDTNNKIVPRSMLKLFAEAAKDELYQFFSNEGPTILRPKNLESSVYEVSKDKITDMGDEFPEYRTVFNNLKNYCPNFPAEEDILIHALVQCGLSEINIRAEIDRLKEIGVLKEYQRKKSDPVRYHIPDIYLKGMQLVRRGG